jgi:biotin transport system substrate-specific component
MPTATVTTPSRASSFTAFAATIPGRILIGLAATLFVAAAAHAAFPLPFTPVPFTLQPLAVLLVGLALGPVDGFLVMLAYLAEGACGLPVFTPSVLGGGVPQLLGPTGGFLMSYPIVAFLAGGITSRLRRIAPVFVAALVACTVAVILLFAFGAGWFYQLTHLPLRTILTDTVFPYLPGEAVKILAAAGIFSTLSRRSRI